MKIVFFHPCFFFGNIPSDGSFDFNHEVQAKKIERLGGKFGGRGRESGVERHERNFNITDKFEKFYN